MPINANGVARFNRITLSEAQRFVFSRGRPPAEFIRKYFGIALPELIKLSWSDGLAVEYGRKVDLP